MISDNNVPKETDSIKSKSNEIGLFQNYECTIGINKTSDFSDKVPYEKQGSDQPRPLCEHLDHDWCSKIGEPNEESSHEDRHPSGYDFARCAEKEKA